MCSFLAESSRISLLQEGQMAACRYSQRGNGSSSTKCVSSSANRFFLDWLVSEIDAAWCVRASVCSRRARLTMRWLKDSECRRQNEHTRRAKGHPRMEVAAAADRTNSKCVVVLSLLLSLVPLWVYQLVLAHSVSDLFTSTPFHLGCLPLQWWAAIAGFGGSPLVVPPVSATPS